MERLCKVAGAIIPAMLAAFCLISAAPARRPATGPLGGPASEVSIQRVGGPLWSPSGFVFKGANVPFGRLMWGPSDAGYSINFLSGSEMPRGYDRNLPVLPTFDPERDGPARKGPTRDSGRPGYFHSLAESGIETELTATSRAGIGRVAFPGSRAPAFVFSFETSENEVRQTGPRELQGWFEMFWGKKEEAIRQYFDVRFDQDIERVSHGESHEVVWFKRQTPRVVQLKLSTSYVSAENAALNLETEIPAWDFEAVRDAAYERWNEALSRIELEGGTPEQRRSFYTHFYHALFHPNVFTDVNGQYLGFDDRPHAADGREHYANFSGWDIYRSWVQLAALLFPDEVSDMMQSLVLDAREAHGGMPRWPVANRETGVMDNGSATPIVASAYAFGATRFDVHEAFEILDRSESVPGIQCQQTVVRPNLKEYLSLGYVPFAQDKIGIQAASSTLEYAMADYSLSVLAGSLGKKERAAYYLKLSENWRNLYSSDAGLIQPKLENGDWWSGEALCSRVDPFQKCGFTEGNAYQYTWFVPHDLPGLVSLMGGPDRAEERLDDFFRSLNATWLFAHEWIGNEEGFSTPWTYNWIGRPWKTQEVVRRILMQEFQDRLPGADDLGAMGSWATWAALGLFPAVPGLGGLSVSAPLFPKVTIHRPRNADLEIVGHGAAADSPYVQKLVINGEDYSKTWIPLERLSKRRPARVLPVVAAGEELGIVSEPSSGAVNRRRHRGNSA